MLLQLIDVEDIIVALRSTHVINSEKMVALLGDYLDEKKNILLIDSGKGE